MVSGHAPTPAALVDDVRQLVRDQDRVERGRRQMRQFQEPVRPAFVDVHPPVRRDQGDSP